MSGPADEEVTPMEQRPPADAQATPVDYFDAPVAEVYDDDNERFGAEHLELETGFLAELAGAGGRALELAIGTGRVALPLAARGIEVVGIDLSEAMVEQLRRKPGGDAIPVTIGSFTSTTVPGSFDLAYLVFNTIGNVASQDGQVATFANAAAHLRPGGSFVLETGVPGLRGLPPTQRYTVFSHTDDHSGIDEYDPVEQLMWSHHYTRRDDGSYQRRSIPFRYVWPAELDLMARLAGMTLTQRWEWWDRRPFTEFSTTHVSVWTKPGP